MSALGQKRILAKRLRQNERSPRGGLSEIQSDIFDRSNKGHVALPAKADICSALAHVCDGPKADMSVARDDFRQTC
jgi:hypothetical protein